MRIVNAYTIAPNEIQAGDVMMFTVKAMVVRRGLYRLYCCPYPYVCHAGQDVPQGSRILNEREICEQLFPSLAQVAAPDPN